jgi:DegV family protein with EDD domain
MKPVAIITDSTSDIPPELTEKLRILVVPLQISFGSLSYRENVDLSRQEFYRFLALSNCFPITREPSIDEFNASFRSIPPEQSIISLHLSGKLSNTYKMACESEHSVRCSSGRDITVIDTGTAGLGLGMIVIRAAEMAQEGWRKGDIIDEIQAMIQRTRAVALLQDLSNLSRSGRIGKAGAFFSDLVSLTPVVSLEQGEVMPVAKVLGLKKGIKSMMNYVKTRSSEEPPRFISVICGTRKKGQEHLLAEVTGLYPSARVLQGTAGAVICTHLGSSLLSLIWH